MKLQNIKQTSEQWKGICLIKHRLNEKQNSNKQNLATLCQYKKKTIITLADDIRS